MIPPEAIYTINWDRLLTMFVPGIRNRFKHFELLKAFTDPLFLLYQEFTAFREKSIYKVSHNASIISLEEVLNDHFDPSLRRIEIENTQRVDAVRVYTVQAQKEVGIFTNAPVGIRSAAEGADGADFLVKVPHDLLPLPLQEQEGLTIRIRAQLDYYKLYAKKYKILWIP